jgi:predicted nucleotidyltransferase/DNA-binding XRE family transcriptional regulator
MKNTLKLLRNKASMTQVQAASFLNVSLCTYKSYETDISKTKTNTYLYMQERLEKLTLIDENHGILTYIEVQQTVTAVLKKYPITYCYLFGSYAKGKASAFSDVDLLVSNEVGGLNFYGLVEDLRNTLHKKVDLLTVDQLSGNPQLTDEILKTGIKIYGDTQEQSILSKKNHH